MNFLRFGDIIAFSFSKEKNEKKRTGYLSCSDLVDNHLYLELSSTYGSKSVNLASERPPNFSDYLFQIIPVLKSKFHREYWKLQQTYREMIKDLGPNTSSDGFLKIKKLTEEKLEKLKLKVDEEANLNSDLIRRNNEEPVIYGKSIQLRHYNTGGFLKVSNNYQFNDRTGFNCEIRSWLSPGMTFVIYPKFKSHQIGDKILINDQIFIYNAKYQSYLNYKEQEMESEYFQTPLAPFLPALNFYSKNYQKHLAFFSPDAEAFFEVIIFKFYNEPSKYVKPFELFKIEFSDVQAFLRADTKYSNGSSFKEYAYASSTESEFSLCSLWFYENAPEGIVESQVIRKPNFSSQYAKENTPNFFSPFIRPISSNKIYIRHFATGLYLSYESAAPQSFLALTHKQPSCEFGMVAIEKDEYVVDKKYFKLKALTQRMYIGAISDINVQSQIWNTSASNLKNQMVREESRSGKYGVLMQDKENNSSIIRIERIPFSVSKELSFVKVANIKLRMFKEKLEQRPLKSCEEIRKEQIMMIRMIEFLFGFETESVIDYLEIKAVPFKQRQLLVRESLIIDIIFQIYELFKLRYGNPSAGQSVRFSFNDEVEKQLYLKFLRHCFAFVRYSIKDCRENETYVSQWMLKIISDTLNTNDENDSQIGRVLTQLISNNVYVLENFIDENLIQNVIASMESTKNHYNLEILRAVCINRGKILVKNQRIVTRFLLNEAQYQLFAFFFDMPKNEVILTNKYFGVAFYLKQLGIMKSAGECLDVVRYFMTFMQLMTELCSNNNHEAQQFLSGKLTEPLLFNILESQYASWIKKLALDLFESLYINRERYILREIPLVVHESFNRFVLRDEVKSKLELASRCSETNYPEKIYRYTIDFIDNSPLPSDADDYRLQIKMIRLLAKFIKIGLAHSLDELVHFVDIVSKKVIDALKRSVYNPSPVIHRSQSKDTFLIGLDQDLISLDHHINDLGCEIKEAFTDIFVVELMTLLQTAFISLFPRSAISFMTSLYQQYSASIDQKANTKLDSLRAQSVEDFLIQNLANAYHHHFNSNYFLGDREKKGQLVRLIFEVFRDSSRSSLYQSSINTLTMIYKQHEYFSKGFDQIVVIQNQSEFNT